MDRYRYRLTPGFNQYVMGPLDAVNHPLGPKLLNQIAPSHASILQPVGCIARGGHVVTGASADVRPASGLGAPTTPSVGSRFGP